MSNNIDKGVLDFTLDSFIDYYDLEKLEINKKYFYDHIQQICKSFNVKIELFKSQDNSDFDRNSNNYFIPFELAPILHLMIILFNAKGKSNSKELGSSVAKYMEKFIDTILDIERAYAIKILDLINFDACCALAYKLPRLIDTLALFFKVNLDIADSLVSEQISDIINYFDKLTNNYIYKKRDDDILKSLIQGDYKIYNLNKQEHVLNDHVYDFSSCINETIDYIHRCFSEYIDNEWGAYEISSDELSESDLNEFREELYEGFYYINLIENYQSYSEKAKIINRYKRNNDKFMTIKGLKHHCAKDYELFHSDIIIDLANNLKLLKKGAKVEFSSCEIDKYGQSIIKEIIELSTKDWNSYEETLKLKSIADKFVSDYFEKEMCTYNEIYLINKFLQLGDDIQAQVDFIKYYHPITGQNSLSDEELVNKFKLENQDIIENDNDINYSEPIKNYIYILKEKDKIINDDDKNSYNFKTLTNAADIMAGQIIAPYISNLINKVK